MIRDAIRTFAERRAARFAEPVESPAPASLPDLLSLPAAVFDRQLVEADPLFAQLGFAEIELVIDRAVADGRARALAWAGCTPKLIADALGLTVVVTDASNRFGRIFQFAEYTSRPAQIVIYRAAMDLLRSLIREHGVAERLGIGDPEPVYLAHEIYHHLARTEPMPGSHEVTTLAFGPIRLRSGLVSLEEVAAAAFASAVTGIRCHPRLLDILASNALRSS